MPLLFALALLTMTLAPASTVCRIGSSWQGSPAELAAIEAVHQAQSARSAGQAFTTGAPSPSPWTGLVRCSQT